MNESNRKRQHLDQQQDDNCSIAGLNSEWSFNFEEDNGINIGNGYGNEVKELKLKMTALEAINQVLKGKLENLELKAQNRALKEESNLSKLREENKTIRQKLKEAEERAQMANEQLMQKMEHLESQQKQIADGFEMTMGEFAKKLELLEEKQQQDKEIAELKEIKNQLKMMNENKATAGEKLEIAKEGKVRTTKNKKKLRIDFDSSESDSSESESSENEEEEEEEEEEADSSASADSIEKYEVEEILGKKVLKNGQEKYYVSDLLMDGKINYSWEPKKGLENLEVFKEWESKQKENEGENGSDDDEDEEEDEEENGYYKVEQILDRKMDKKGKIKYFIKWEGKNNRWNSWEPRENLTHLDVLKEYEAKNKRKTRNNN